MAYILADAGYDMWILNNRGSTYSKAHVNLNPERDKTFWDFSFHEQGVYDLPQIIDYVLNLTRQKDLFFIGYSMGATIGHVMCSTRPEYNAKIRHFVNFAPVTDTVHILPPSYNIVFSVFPEFVKSLRAQNITELFPRRALAGNILRSLCQNGSSMQSICVASIFLIVGVDYKQFNPELFPHIFRYFPDGSSLKTAEHFIQIMSTGIFREYDYGTTGNRIMYGSDAPPKYNLSQVTAATSIYYGAGDIISTKADCEYLAKKLPNAMGLFKIPYHHFNHMDFMWATNVRQLLYDPLVNLLNKYK
ncbi:alpha/beta hydrolase fold [Popillia japonica]|uniref:Alpha/beta hydrolase fold n=1 Tax=Popillia japonica TaxID=7064 RepID=A0AAW1JW13_POPJA